MMETIDEGAAEAIVTLLEEGSSDAAGVDGAGDCREAVEGFREDAAGVWGADLEIGNEKDERESGIDVRAEGGRAGFCNGESAEGGGCGVVGVAFETGTEFEEADGVKGMAAEFVEAVKESEADGNRGAESAGLWDVAFNLPGNGEGGESGGFEEKIGGVGSHSVESGVVGTVDGDFVVEMKCDAEAVEARTEIGGGAWNADGDHRKEIYGFRFQIYPLTPSVRLPREDEEGGCSQ